MDPLQVFENFKLDTLDNKWSDEVWDREFLSFPEPPVEYSILLGSEDMELFLKETRDTLKKWMNQNQDLDKSNDQQRSEVSWQTLTALDINIRGLLAVLAYLMKVGQAAGADEDSRQACLASASLYLTLLNIPGCSTFHVFHPHLYQRALETLKLSEHLVANRKHQRANDLESLYGDQPDEMLPSEKKTLIKGLNSILFELITLLETFYMKYQMRSLEITIMNLVELTKLETDRNVFLVDHINYSEASLTTLTYNAYVALQDLCDPRHGDPKNTIILIMGHLFPNLCVNVLDLPAKAANILWDTIILFVKKLLNSQGTAAEMGMEILVQNLLARHPERSDPRQKQAGIVAKLINICQGRNFCKSITNLVLFCHNSKVSYRIFGQEVIIKLLPELSENTTENELDMRKKTKAILIATAFSRSIDTSSMVRGKAMSIVESLINDNKFKVEDLLNMEQTEKPLPSLNELLEALEEDINPLPGPSTFNSVLLDRIADERALVRRSTIHAIKNIVTYFPTLIDQIVPTLGKHCRDPALSVRRDAIQTLATLLENNPNNNILLHEYVKSALPRIYDVEIKVQEKVLDTLQYLVLTKIKPSIENSSEEVDQLPWKIIQLITALKMRKNLLKICEYWVKNGVITNSLVSKVQMHVGTDHDMESWVLLSVFAGYTKLTNMKQYYEDYKNMLEDNDFVSYLKLETLVFTWQGMGRDFLENLHGHIFECLCKFRINIESISICLDLLSGMTKRLNPGTGDDLLRSYASDLMKLSEAQIDKLPEEKEEIESKTIDLYLKAMNTLGHASFLCSNIASGTSLHIVQSLLLDCSNIPTSAHNADRLKAAGIILIAQQSMRDREFAETAMPVLGQLMSKSGSSESPTQAAIRINAVKALADLCVRFTALVEPFLPDMCICMKDPNPQVRETIIVIFVQLLLEDFIKVKGAFFYHILTMLSDEDETIRELTVFLIKQRLLAKNKNLISQSFVRSIFHYNNCQTKNKFNDRAIKKKEKDALTLPGNKNQAKRRIIYNFMMEHLDPPSKIKILMKLNSEVFEAACEKFIPVKKTEGACVLKDVMYIISNERLQANYGSKVIDDENQDEAPTAMETQTSNAVNVIVEGMKKFKKEVMFNTLIKLREMLKKSKSPLMVDASKFFIKFLSQFNKDQLADMFDEHAALKKEIDHDMSLYGRNPEEDEEEEEDEAVSEADSGVEQSTLNRSATEDSESECSKTLKDINANVSPKKLSQEKKSISSPTKIQDICCQQYPRIVLRRLSTLTYPGIKAWRSPPREEATCSRLSDPGPSSSGISVSSQITTESTTSPDSSESESTSLPRPKKMPRYSEDISDDEDS
ncbi:condensin-2 complex subunit D3-L-like [Phymastichus coffea]|uniref:condensin-2 complex subunit D3-L-like n=1 Tax=Phymastichus coffea TaxID=108790 RepID=UPI00273B29BF|nr:condensin-2 complex subunit D3-L-like [Phymastichus coffea]